MRSVKPAKGGVRIRADAGSGKGKATAMKQIDVNDPHYVDVDDPKRIIGPVPGLVCPALRNAWKINNFNSMGFIFDVINPARQFKRGMEYDEQSDSPYADYDPDPKNDPNVTETDEDATTQPYNPKIYRYVHQVYLCFNNYSFCSNTDANIGGKTMELLKKPSFNGTKVKWRPSTSENQRGGQRKQIGSHEPFPSPIVVSFTS